MEVSRLFWPQELLDQWIVEEKIILEGETLTIQCENQAYRVQQAVYFTSDVGSGEDAHKLVGRVKAVQELEEMGAEHYMDSVIIEDSAYQVVTGFLGEQFPADRQESAPQSVLLGDTGKVAETDNEDNDDKELLARFLIENL